MIVSATLVFQCDFQCHIFMYHTVPIIEQNTDLIHILHLKVHFVIHILIPPFFSKRVEIFTLVELL